MRLFTIQLILLLPLISHQLWAWEGDKGTPHPFRVMFYNTENFFDAYDDPTTDDDEFTPASFRRWDVAKFKQKANRIGQIIAAVGEWRQVELVGLCEVENDTVLQHLTRYTALKQAGYSYLSTHSSDPRGIDVALLYQKETFRLLTDTAYRINICPNTRDILHAKGVVPSGDTLHVLVAHLPSKRGGSRATEERRKKVLQRLSEIHRTILRESPASQVLFMGDFNDEAHRIAALSPTPILFERPYGKIDSHSLYALLPSASQNKGGSYKYQGTWSCIDQIIVSGTLLHRDTYPQVKEQKAHIFAPDHLLTSDPDFGGSRPLRTYQGRQYIGGYSDHLPVYCDLLLKY